MESPPPSRPSTCDEDLSSDEGNDAHPAVVSRPRAAQSVMLGSPTASVCRRPAHLDPTLTVDDEDNFFSTRPRSTGSQLAAPSIVFSSPEDDDNAELVAVTETPLTMLGMPTLMVAHRARSPSVCEPAPAAPVPAVVVAPTALTSPPARPRAPSHPVSATITPHYGTMPRHGFPQAHNPAVAAAESQFHRSVAMQQLALCEAQWGPALRGVQMLAHSVPAEVLPLRRLARKFGIPPHVRGIMWLTLSGVAHRAEENQGFCDALLDTFGTPPGETALCIEKDLERTFPDHPLFSGDQSQGQQRLRRVLHALCWRNPLIGYCQGFNFMAGLLLLFLDDEEAVFWTMCYLLERVLPNDYFASNLVGIRTDQYVLCDLVRARLPKLAAHLDRIGFDAGVLVPTWLMSLFVGVLPVSSVVPVWDYILSREPTAEPSAVPLALCLALLKMHQDAIVACSDVGETLVLLSQLVQTTCNGLAVVKIAHELKLDDELVRSSRRRHRTRLAQEAAQRQVELRRIQSAARVTEQSRALKTVETRSMASSASGANSDTNVMSPVGNARRLPGSRARDSFGASPQSAKGEAGLVLVSSGEDSESLGDAEEMGDVKNTTATT